MDADDLGTLLFKIVCAPRTVCSREGKTSMKAGMNSGPAESPEEWIPVSEKYNLHDDDKFKLKKFRRPPKYLRQDQPKNKWIVKPTKLDLMKDADAVLESLVEHRVPRTRRFERKKRQRRRKVSGAARKQTVKNARNGKLDGTRAPKPPARTKANGQGKSGGRRGKLARKVVRKKLQLHTLDPHAVAWSSKSAVKDFAGEGYAMPEGRRLGINALHDPANYDHPMNQADKVLRRKLHGNANDSPEPSIVLAQARIPPKKGSVEEDSYFLEDDAGNAKENASSSEDEQIPGTVYDRVKFKMNVYREDRDLREELMQRAKVLRKEKEIANGKYNNGRNFVAEHQDGRHIFTAKHKAEIRRLKEKEHLKKGEIVRTSRTLQINAREAENRKKLYEKMTREQMRKEQELAATLVKKWFQAISLTARTSTWEEILRNDAKKKASSRPSSLVLNNGKPAASKPRRRRGGVVKKISVEEIRAKQKEEEQKRKEAIAIVQKSARRWLSKLRRKQRQRAKKIIERYVKGWVRFWINRRNGRLVDMLRSFLSDQVDRNLIRVMRRFRLNIVKTQRMFRSFRACKHARIIALSLRWDKVEVDYAKLKATKKSRELNGEVKRLRIKGAGDKRQDRLTIHQRRLERNKAGIEDEPADQFLGEEPAALLEHHLLKGLENLIDKAAPTNNVPVAFNFRFMMLHTFLTRVRRKHGNHVSELKSALAIQNQLVSLDDLKLMSQNGFAMSVNDAIAQRNQDPLPDFQPYTGITERQMLNLVKEGHAYEDKFTALGVPFTQELQPLPFVERFFQRRKRMDKKFAKKMF